jgi:vacuolar protein sorting-associated protein 26
MFGFGPSATIDVQFDGSDKRLKKQLKREGGEVDSFEIYQGHEAVSGVCKVIVAPGKKVEHIGIKIEMIGQIGDGQMYAHPYLKFNDLLQNSFTIEGTITSSHLWCESSMLLEF